MTFNSARNDNWHYTREIILCKIFQVTIFNISKRIGIWNPSSYGFFEHNLNVSEKKVKWDFFLDTDEESMNNINLEIPDPW
jgi:hypothetical protein